MSLPLPGASFVYSLLKNVGRWGWTRLHDWHLPNAEAFQRWTVDKWYEPVLVIDQFGDPLWLSKRGEVRDRCVNAVDEMVKLSPGYDEFSIEQAEVPEDPEASPIYARAKYLGKA